MTKTEAIDKTTDLISKGKVLPEYKKDNNQEYDKWYRKVEDFFTQLPYMDTYSKDLVRFKDNPVQQGFDEVWNSKGEFDRYSKIVKDTIALLDSANEEIVSWNDNIEIDLKTTKQGNTTVNIFNISNNIPKTKVFIVHGHDELAISQVSEVLIKLNLAPIVLRDQVSRSATVIEKIEKHTNDVGFGIILYTECDIGGKDVDSLQSRARQNVVLEHGYLMAKLGRENTFALVKGKVEKPGDINGVVYEPMDDHKAWAFALAKELIASGYEIDLNRLL